MTVNDGSVAAYQRAALDAVAADPIAPLRLTVISNSMWPLLRTGDAICIQSIEPAAFRVSDVVVVRRGADLITHRLIAIDGEQWVTHGDNAVFTDPPVMRAACLGRVIALERGPRSIDVTQPRWAKLNRRLGRLGRTHWQVNRTLRLTPTSSPLGIRLAWLIALPFRAVAHILTRWVRAD